MWSKVRDWGASIGMFLVSAALGVVAANQVFEASRLLFPILIPVNPQEMSAWNRLMVTVPRVLLIVLGIAWFGAVVVTMHLYTRAPLDLGRSWRLFRWTLLVEVILIALASLVIYGMPGL